MAKKKSKKNKQGSREIKRDLPFKEHGTEYCQVIKMYGGARFDGKCFDGKNRLCIIRGSMSGRRKVWIKVGDFVLVGLRDFQDDKCDVILKYTDDEIKALISYGELPNNIIIGSTDTSKVNDADLGVDFEDETLEEDKDFDFDDI